MIMFFLFLWLHFELLLVLLIVFLSQSYFRVFFLVCFYPALYLFYVFIVLFCFIAVHHCLYSTSPVHVCFLIPFYINNNYFINNNNNVFTI